MKYGVFSIALLLSVFSLNANASCVDDIRQAVTDRAHADFPGKTLFVVIPNDLKAGEGSYSSFYIQVNESTEYNKIGYDNAIAFYGVSADETCSIEISRPYKQ